MAGVSVSSWPCPFLLCPLARSPQSCATATRCRVDRDVCRPQPVAGVDRIGEANLEIIFADNIRWLSTGGVSSLGKSPSNVAYRGGGVTKKAAAKKLREPPFDRSEPSTRSGAGTALHRAVGTIRVDVERTGSPLDHFA